MSEMDRVSLYCTEGGSDKVYTLWIEKKGDLYTVEAQWGRRGGPQQTGTKTSSSVSLEKARAAYEKVLKEKRAKGYHEGEDAPAYSQVEGAQDTGLRPMLLTDCSEMGPDAFISDNAWVGQEKMNGKRILIRVKDGKVIGSNRRGLACPIPEVLTKELAGLKQATTFDGELVGETYHAFDLLELVDDIRQWRFGKRHDALTDCFEGKFEHVKMVERHYGEESKRELVEDLKSRRKEGVVFKLLGGSYIPGKIENLAKAVAVKVKFYAEVAAKVIGWTGKQSIEVALLNGDDLISVGKVTVPTKYVDQIKDGRIVRVKYLYATTADQLFQAHLDPDGNGSVIADHDEADPISALKHEGKEEE